MADQGFLVNDLGGGSGAETAVTAAYATGKFALLEANTDVDARSKAMPQSCYLSHLELNLTATTGSPTTIDCFLTWDAQGNDALTSQATDVALHAGVTTAAILSCAVSLDVFVTAPTDQTTDGKVYLWLRTDTGEVSITRARLNWVVR
jgi:hypothetical protein